MDYKKRLKEIIENICVQKSITNEHIKEAILNVPREIFSENLDYNVLYSQSKLKYYGAWEISDLEFVIDILANSKIENTSKVLVIGSGTGYLLAILSYLAEEIYGIEIDRNLNDKCMDNIEELGIINAISKVGDGKNGWGDEAKFNLIVVCCSFEEIPAEILNQLEEGGEVLIPLGNLNMWPDQYQELYKVEKSGGNLVKKKISEVFVNPVIYETNKVVSE